jgi:hypothetical protein
LISKLVVRFELLDFVFKLIRKKPTRFLLAVEIAAVFRDRDIIT